MINGIDKYIELPYTIVNNAIDTSLYGNIKVFKRFDGDKVVADDEHYNRVVSIIREVTIQQYKTITPQEIDNLSQEQVVELANEYSRENEKLPSRTTQKALFANLFLAYTLYYPSVKRYKDLAPYIVDISKEYAETRQAYGALNRCDSIKVEISDGKMVGISVRSKSDEKNYNVDSTYFLLATYDLQEFGFDWMYSINDADIVFRHRRGRKCNDFGRAKNWLRKTLYREDAISGGGKRTNLDRKLGENFQALYRFLWDNIDHLNLGNKDHTKEYLIVNFIIKLFDIGVDSTKLKNYCRRKPKSKIRL